MPITEWPDGVGKDINPSRMTVVAKTGPHSREGLGNRPLCYIIKAGLTL
jgi:hypothetical protein